MMRLNRYLAMAGVGSRRRVDEIIFAGDVTINGKNIDSPGYRICPGDVVTVKGRQIRPGICHIYLLMNKPVGCLTAMSDSRGRPTVKDYLKGINARIYPVGRLDQDVGGALLFTNDGELAYRLAHPRYGVEKIYRVTVKGIPLKDTLDTLRRGVKLEEGITAPAKVKIMAKKTKPEAASILEITIHQGWKRQVKRMCRAIGHPLIKMERHRFAFLGKDDLKPGKYRYLSEDEVRRLKELVK